MILLIKLYSTTPGVTAGPSLNYLTPWDSEIVSFCVTLTMFLPWDCPQDLSQGCRDAPSEMGHASVREGYQPGGVGAGGTGTLDSARQTPRQGTDLSAPEGVGAGSFSSPTTQFSKQL